MERTLRRRERFEITILASEFLIGLVLGGLLTGATHFEGWFLVSSLGPVAFTALFFQRGFGMSRTATMNLLERLRPQLRDVGIRRFAPLIVVLDNGLVLRSMGPVSMVWLFFSHSGEVLVPKANDAERWLKKPWRLRRVGVVGPRRGPPEARADLAALRSSLGVKIMGAGLQERRPEDLARDPAGPMWIGSTILSTFGGLHRVPTIVSDLGAIGSLLHRLLGTYFRHPMPAGFRA